MLCRNCGKQIDKKNKFCAACGASIAGAHKKGTGPAKKRQIRRYHHVEITPGAHPFKDGFEVTISQFSSLLGVNYLTYLLITLAMLFTIFVPFVGIAFSFLLVTALMRVHIEAVAGREANHRLLFSLFGKRSWRIIGANSIVALYLFLWCLIPIAGPFIAIQKSYTYRFVPYIMASNPNVSAVASIEISKQMTKGLKRKMFRADFFFALIFIGVNTLLALLCSVPVVNIVAIGVAIFLDMAAPIFAAMYQATFFPTTGLRSAPTPKKKDTEPATPNETDNVQIAEQGDKSDNVTPTENETENVEQGDKSDDVTPTESETENAEQGDKPDNPTPTENKTENAEQGGAAKEA